MKRITLTQKNQKEVIDTAIEVLTHGGLVIYPTETCYGIGADATNQNAVDTLLQYKTKRKDKALSVAVASQDMAARYVHINATAKHIYDNFLPGPISVISKGKQMLANGVESSMGTQAIRIPNYPLLLTLLQQYDRPITSTSANASYKKTPYTIDDILNNISNKQTQLIGLIIDAGKLPKRKPSTIVDTTLEDIHIVRKGGITLEHSHTYIANTLEDTSYFINEIFSQIHSYIGQKPIVFLLQGDLGAGKTTMTKRIAKKLDIDDIIVSPTYTVCRQYKGKKKHDNITLYHIDTYRMYEPSEMEDLRPDELFQPTSVVVIEWANKVYDYIKPLLHNAVTVTIRISVVKETTRHFEYTITT